MEVQTETGPHLRSQGSKITVNPSAVCIQGIQRGHITCPALHGTVGDLALPSGSNATGRPKEGSNQMYVKSTDHNNITKFKIQTKNDNLNYHYTEKCYGNRCSCCKHVNNNQLLNCTVTNKQFDSHTDYDHINCNTKNIVYLITCDKCKLQYIGQTIRKLKDRIREHIYSIKKNETNTYLVEHFNEEGHCIEDLKVQIIETVTIQIEKGKNRKECEEAEDFWIRQFITAFPFGLNDRIKCYGDVSSGIIPATKTTHPYFCKPISTEKRNRKRTKKRESRKVDPDIMEKAKRIHNSDHSCFDRHKLYLFLRSLSKKNLLVINDSIKMGNMEFWHEDIKLATQAYMAGYYNKNKIINKQKGIIIVANFPNKGMEMLKLETIFKDRRLQKAFTFQNKKSEQAIITYKYVTPISRKLFNYNYFLKKLNISEIRNIAQNKCECVNSKFVYNQFHHIITGDLNIVENTKLRNLFGKGAKYREPTAVNWIEVKDSAITAVNEYVRKTIRKCTTSKRRFILRAMEDYKKLSTKIIDNRIRFLAENVEDNTQMLSILCQQQCYKELKRLHAKFVIAPADKASNNFIFICKKYYTEVMCKELGIEIDNNGDYSVAGNLVYEPSNIDGNRLIEKHKRLTAQNGIAKFGEDNECLPVIFATPKLHKDPYKFRFIAGARNSSTKPMSKILHQILGHFQKHFERYCAIVSKRKGFNCYWSIKGSLEALRRIEHKIQSKKLDSICTADFSSLYTMFPHNVIKEQLCKLTDMLFNHSNKRFVVISYANVYYADQVDASNIIVLDKNEVKSLISDVIDETYVIFGGFHFRQSRGVPMGGNASPLIADLTLSMLEYIFLTKNENMKLAKAMTHTMRYIDDILSLNCEKFLEYAKLIYPTCLPLDNTAKSAYESCFLDIHINLNLGYKRISVYNKTDDFNFHVVRYGFASSNVHTSMGYKVLYSQLIRMGRICNNLKDFEIRVKQLIDTLSKNGYNKSSMSYMFFKFATAYSPLLLKFKLDNKIKIAKFGNRLITKE